MKTTLDIDDTLLRNAKVLAAQQGSSLTRLIEDSLRIHLRAKKRPAGSARRAPVIKVYRGKGGLLPGIDPTSNRSMLDAADGL
jgi:hypothetical protein